MNGSMHWRIAAGEILITLAELNSSLGARAHEYTGLAVNHYKRGDLAQSFEYALKVKELWEQININLHKCARAWVLAPDVTKYRQWARVSIDNYYLSKQQVNAAFELLMILDK